MPPAAADSFTSPSRANPRGTLCATAWRASDAPGAVMSMTKVTVTDTSTEWKRPAVNQIAVERTKAKE